MVVNCLIEFIDNPQDIYYAGQVISGKVTITADKQKLAKAVTLEIIGMAHTKWCEEDFESETTYYGQIDYIKTKTFLLKSPQPASSGGSFPIEAGVYSFSFSCLIPPNSPSSIEALHGYIRYWVQITLKRPWKFDQKYTKGFTVHNIQNMNVIEDKEKQLPVKNNVLKLFCCGPCQSDPFKMEVQLPQTGFVPGQFIPINILINNNTATDVNEISARLVMTIDCYSTHPIKKHKQETKTVSILKGDPVLRLSNKQFNYLLPIPATPPTCTTLCSIIQIGYRVEVEAKMNGLMYKNQCVHVPITIGNVPLQVCGVVVEQQPMLRNFDMESIVKDLQNNITVLSLTANDENITSFPSNKNISPWSEMVNIAPPAYMEARHMLKGQLSEDDEHDYGEKIFTPKYPVFNLSTSLQTSAKPANEDEVDGHVVTTTMADPDKTTWL